MALIHIKRNHGLSREEARGKIDEIATRLADEFKVKHAWDGDVLRFKRTGATGAIVLGDKVVDVKVKLGMVLVPMKGKIEKAIIQGLEKVGADG